MYIPLQVSYSHQFHFLVVLKYPDFLYCIHAFHTRGTVLSLGKAFSQRVLEVLISIIFSIMLRLVYEFISRIGGIGHVIYQQLFKAHLSVYKAAKKENTKNTLYQKKYWKCYGIVFSHSNTGIGYVQQ